jgi:hypothetical protein
MGRLVCRLHGIAQVDEPFLHGVSPRIAGQVQPRGWLVWTCDNKHGDHLLSLSDPDLVARDIIIKPQE